MNARAVPPDKQLQTDRVPQFSEHQLKYLQGIFPEQIFTHTATPEQMHQYFGAQRVLDVIKRARTRHAGS